MSELGHFSRNRVDPHLGRLGVGKNLIERLQFAGPNYYCGVFYVRITGDGPRRHVVQQHEHVTGDNGKVSRSVESQFEYRKSRGPVKPIGRYHPHGSDLRGPRTPPAAQETVNIHPSRPPLPLPPGGGGGQYGHSAHGAQARGGCGGHLVPHKAVAPTAGGGVCQLPRVCGAQMSRTPSPPTPHLSLLPISTGAHATATRQTVRPCFIVFSLLFACPERPRDIS
ncbi:hypothetical protein HPB50_018457 [Hyalomma asiaticum]|uniref:Uncharacterized protein n=1 Tax=Hyalomma asiaticum TaxID=266040 RepID=A0ACB7RST9_HYAAI|nr:hypothetical protein HPB50_018457 [Hyalomma asiaticum]